MHMSRYIHTETYILYIYIPTCSVDLGYRENLQPLNDVRVWPARAALGGTMGNSKVRAAWQWQTSR